MKKTHFKDTIGKIVLSLLLLFLGEGLFNYGLYWPVLFSLVIITRKTYYFTFIFGILVSSLTSSSLGLASLTLVAGLFVFERLWSSLGGRLWLVVLVAFGLSFLTDRILGLSWIVFEGMVNIALVVLLWKLEFFSDEIHLSHR
jgi:hypothetical protein